MSAPGPDPDMSLAPADATTRRVRHVPPSIGALDGPVQLDRYDLMYELGRGANGSCLPPATRS